MTAPASSLNPAPRVIRFTVEGVAQTKGSAKAFVPFKWAEEAVARARLSGKRIGPRAVITNDNTSASAWQDAISAMARIAFNRGPVFEGAVVLRLAFYLPRPKSLRRGAVAHRTRPDADKLTRCVLDGLTSIAYHDDGQVGDLWIRKQYAAEGTRARVEIAITETTADGTNPIAEPRNLFGLEE